MGRSKADNMGMLHCAGLLKVAVALIGLLGRPLAAPSAVQAQAAADASQDAEAKMLFQAGQVAFEAGRFKAALGRWEEAYKLSGRPALQYNIGLALDRLRRDQEAIEAFRSYLTWDAKGKRAQEVRGRIAAIEEAMAERAAAEKAAAEEAAAEKAAAENQAAERAGATAAVASPAEAAATVLDDSTSSPLDGPAPEASMTAQWWFWPTVGVVAAGVIAGVVVAASGAEDEVKPLEMQNVSVTFSTLRHADATSAGASR